MLNPSYHALDYPALDALAAVLQHGSFEAAAHGLSVTPSAISQRIKALEERMGTPLVLRGTPCTGTETGKRLVRHRQEVALLETHLASDLGETAPRRASVPLAVNADSLATWLCAALGQVDGLLFQIQIDDQDHSADWLKRGEVMAAISARDTPVAGCDLIALGAMRYRPVATPAFIAQHFPDGITKETLTSAPSLLYDEKDRLQANWANDKAGARLALTSHRIPSTQGFVDASLAGLGWGINPESLLSPYLARGDLVTLCPDPVDIPLYWHVSRLSKPMLAPLTQAVVKTAKAQLIQ